VEVEPWALPTGNGAKVGGKPTAAADADAGAGAAVEVDRWSRGGTPSGTSGGSIFEWSSHRLPLLGFLVGVDCIIRYHNVADEL
jgi:hypothetical protein